MNMMLNAKYSKPTGYNGDAVGILPARMDAELT
jgi:hypothetical protein